MNRYIFALVLLTTGCFPIYEELLTMDVGTCYYTGGDLGGTPDILKCVQAKGSDGFLSCQGSTRPFTGFRWYACRDAERFRWLNDPVVVECPTPCPGLEGSEK